jgi:hypothetical protein
MVQVGECSVAPSCRQSFPRGQPKRIDECRRNILSVVKGGIGQNLMYVCPMSVADIARELDPHMFVNVGKVSFVLGVYYSNGAPMPYNDIGYEMCH